MNTNKFEVNKIGTNKFDEDKIGSNQFASSHQLLCRFLLLSPLLGGSTGSLFWVVKVLLDQDRLNKVPSMMKLVHFLDKYM